MGKKIVGVGVGVLICCLIFFAAEVRAAENKNVSEKFITGIANVSYGWTELFAQPIKEASEGSPVERFFGAIGGLFVGAGKGIAREIAGAANVIASPLPTDSAISTYPMDDHL